MLKCAAIFTDHMVLVRDRKVCVWGECDTEGIVEVHIDGCHVTTQVVHQKWKAYLPARAAGGPYVLQVTSGAEVIQFQDVYFGEVFLASGQSNMEMELKGCEGGKEEAKNSNYPLIRYYNVLKTGYIDDKVEEEIRSVQWESCIGEKSETMSAVAYYAAKEMQTELDVPIGIIDCYQGGTSISSWLPEEILNRYEIGKKYIDDYKKLVGDKTDEEYEREVEEYWKTWHAWDDKVQELKTANPNISWDEIVSCAGDCPWPQPAGNKSVFRPAGCYASMLRTITPYTLSGIFYYQGETDADYVETAKAYYDLMQALILQWRELFENRELYFVITQLPMFIDKDAEDNGAWAILREQQLRIYENMRNVGLLGISDCGEFGNIHPVDKKTPGTRLGSLVLEEYFGVNDLVKETDLQDMVKCGKAMLPGAIYRQDNQIIIECENTYGAIVVKAKGMDEVLDFNSLWEKQANADGGAKDSSLQESVACFEIAGTDKKFAPCDFTSKGDRIILSVGEMQDVRYVRYAWTNYTNLIVYNNANIPLVPFGEREVH